MPSNPDPLTTLCATISTTKTLLTRFETNIRTTTTHSNQEQKSPSPPNALALLSDASAILKAQTTKLSLLVLNKPFTPSEITFILHSLCRECLPALMSTMELCPAPAYTELLHNLVRGSVGLTMKELQNLLAEIPVDERGIAKTRGRDTLASTGVIWHSCDSMMLLGQAGVSAAAARKVGEYHALFKDAIEELENWVKEELELDGAAVPEPQPTQLPPSSPSESDEREPAAKALKTLRLVRLLFPAMIKRRVSTFPNIDKTTKEEQMPTRKQVDDLDALITQCRLLHETADDIAAALYDEDEEAVDQRLGFLKGYATVLLQRVRRTWDGNDDYFTEWSDKLLDRFEQI